ncbi:MAG: HAMP domain-containing protein [Bdellovibrionaceae bacterium]|nr:HAMP domain-containing protein [Pseudobdellovibrionaceae bacterium]
MKRVRRRPKRSLRTILVIWFLLFSVLPLAFVTGYSMIRYEKAIDHELSQRLIGNAREIGVILEDYRVGLQQKRDRYERDPNLVYHLTMGDSAGLKTQATNLLRQDIASRLSFYNREGRMITSIFKDERSEIRTFSPSQDAFFLPAKYLAHLKENRDIGLIEYGDAAKISLVMISRIWNSRQKVVGYIEQMIDLDKSFVYRLKARMKLEIMLIKDDGRVQVGSSPDFFKIKSDFLKPHLKGEPKESFFEYQLRSNPIGFLVYPIEWGQSNFYVALGASKGDAKAVLRNVNVAFVTVVSAIVLLLVLTVLVTSSWVLKPLYELVDALQSFETQEQLVTIPVKNNTEIGLLTRSFNQMSQNVWQARSDLRKKLSELESTNKELKETQSRLVHSAKMVSLGQLVAGVAHELNNPIGFIYGNMSHLKDYSEKLIDLIRLAEKHTEASAAELAKKKEEYEFDYIIQDLPKLIASCEDGARRTRNIVMGLRNFSRLEEAKLVEIDIHEALDTTLNLLHGELKDRIEIHRQYEPIPRVYCFASQINQVLMNILSNAAQAISGQGHIWISTHALKDPKTKEGQIEISVQDSGQGIPPENLGKIFDPFFTTKGVGSGTGLGLSISYGIIHNHGGEIQVRSELGVGTVFMITLPVNPPVATS